MTEAERDPAGGPEPESPWVFCPDSERMPPIESTSGAPSVQGPEPIPGVQALGGKGHQLTRLLMAGVRVPPFVVLRTEAFRSHANEQEGGTLPSSLLDALRQALSRAGLEGTPLAVRSSAADEDGVHASFAGQFDTVLGVRWERDGKEPGSPDELARAILRVWASASSAHALAYRSASAPATPPDSAATPKSVPMGVVLQAMVDADASGVAFSVDPVQGRRNVAMVSAIRGLGEPLVSGDLDGDTYEVQFPDDLHDTPVDPTDPSPPRVTSTLSPQPHMLRLTDGGGTRVVEITAADLPQPVLSTDETVEIARMARDLARTFGTPQDVEWALVEDVGTPRSLVVLQARPITALPDPPPPPQAGSDAETMRQATSGLETPGSVPSGERRIWDNSNIIESYSGVTTPLTFSFARSVYRDVYVQFCRLLGVSETLLTEQRHVFANMLGLVRGRVYYNLLNWYRLIALLPGYDANRAFMERMMGVEEALGDPPPPPRAGARWRDLGRVVRMVGRMAREYRRLDREVTRFHARLESELAPLAHEDLGERSPDELLALYRHLEDTLLHHWRAPLVNDFFAMIVFGVLGRLTERWLPDEPPTLANDLLCGEGGVISTEPARRIMALARTVRTDDALLARLRAQPDDTRLWTELVEGVDGREPRHPAFRAELLRYLDDFGDRCMNELKLETVTPHEDPAFVIEMVRAYVEVGAMDPEAGTAREQRIRAEAEARVRSGLGGPRRWIYRWLLRQSRHRIRDRENLRFERTRVFGIVRRIVLALGEHLARTGELEDRQHVFYLTLEELFAHVEGTGVTDDLAGLARLRKAEFDAFREESDPPPRFETVGPPTAGTPPGAAGWEDSARLEPGGESTDGPGDTAAELTGLGCCPGRIRAPVRLVTDPRHPGELSGHILVAARTDPGWTLLFPRAEGILVERGSLLSHSAIVAREMGLPCVVGVRGLMTTLTDGEIVEMDGTTGRILRVDA